MRAPDLRFAGVGVAGFEPTASSSRNGIDGQSSVLPVSAPRSWVTYNCR
jgi:hypothetical protein